MQFFGDWFLSSDMTSRFIYVVWCHTGHPYHLEATYVTQLLPWGGCLCQPENKGAMRGEGVY